MHLEIIPMLPTLQIQALNIKKNFGAFFLHNNTYLRRINGSLLNTSEVVERCCLKEILSIYQMAPNGATSSHGYSVAAVKRLIVEYGVVSQVWKFHGKEEIGLSDANVLENHS